MACLDVLGEDEIEALAFMAHRAVKGMKVYGRLDLDRDERDLIREASEEGADLVFYLVCELLRLQRKRGRPW